MGRGERAGWLGVLKVVHGRLPILCPSSHVQAPTPARLPARAAGKNFTQAGPVLKVRGEVLVGPDFAKDLNSRSQGYNPQGFTTHVSARAAGLRWAGTWHTPDGWPAGVAAPRLRRAKAPASCTRALPCTSLHCGPGSPCVTVTPL